MIEFQNFKYKINEAGINAIETVSTSETITNSKNKLLLSGLEIVRTKSKISKLEKEFSLDPLNSITTRIADMLSDIGVHSKIQYLSRAKKFFENIEESVLFDPMLINEVLGEEFNCVADKIDKNTEIRVIEYLNEQIESINVEKIGNEISESKGNFENRIKSKLESVGLLLNGKLEKSWITYMQNNEKGRDKIFLFLNYLTEIKTNYCRNVNSLSVDIFNKENNSLVADQDRYQIKDIKTFFGGGIYPELSGSIEVDISARDRMMLRIENGVVKILFIGMPDWH